jgi:hypothetical protein
MSEYRISSLSHCANTARVLCLEPRRQLDASPLTKSALPTELTPLLGRDPETIRLHALLCRTDGASRLITITGPGGVGNTSLAVRVAHEAPASSPHGVYFISLAPISDPTFILPTIAQSLSLPESPRRLWLDSLKNYLLLGGGIP